MFFNTFWKEWCLGSFPISKEDPLDCFFHLSSSLSRPLTPTLSFSSTQFNSSASTKKIAVHTICKDRIDGPMVLPLVLLWSTLNALSELLITKFFKLYSFLFSILAIISNIRSKLYTFLLTEFLFLSLYQSISQAIHFFDVIILAFVIIFTLKGCF